METNAAYVDILIMSLKKKITILEELERLVYEEETVLKKHKVTIEEIDCIEREKERILGELEKSDDGFQRVYHRVKEEFEENRYRYEKEIKTMQGMIRTITDYTAQIQAQEIRNKQLMEYFIQKKKSEVKSFQFNQRTASKYTTHLADSTVGEAHFIDNKK